MKNLKSYFKSKGADNDLDVFRALLKTILKDIQVKEEKEKEVTAEDVRDLLNYKMHEYLKKTGFNLNVINAIKYINPMSVIQMYLKLGSYLAEKEETNKLSDLETEVYVFNTLNCQVIALNPKNILSFEAICAYRYKEDLLAVLKAIRHLLNKVYPLKNVNALIGDE